MDKKGTICRENFCEGGREGGRDHGEPTFCSIITKRGEEQNSTLRLKICALDTTYSGGCWCLVDVEWQTTKNSMCWYFGKCFALVFSFASRKPRDKVKVAMTLLALIGFSCFCIHHMYFTHSTSPDATATSTGYVASYTTPTTLEARHRLHLSQAWQNFVQSTQYRTLQSTHDYKRRLHNNCNTIHSSLPNLTHSWNTSPSLFWRNNSSVPPSQSFNLLHLQSPDECFLQWNPKFWNLRSLVHDDLHQGSILDSSLSTHSLVLSWANLSHYISPSRSIYLLPQHFNSRGRFMAAHDMCIVCTLYTRFPNPFQGSTPNSISVITFSESSCLQNFVSRQCKSSNVLHTWVPSFGLAITYQIKSKMSTVYWIHEWNKHYTRAHLLRASSCIRGSLLLFLRRHHIAIIRCEFWCVERY